MTAFEDWLVNAKPKDRHIYYVGHLAFDREQSKLGSIYRLALRDAHEALAKATMDKPPITLVQRRIDNHVYEYIAIKL